jgi:hypothetical protein
LAVVVVVAPDPEAAPEELPHAPSNKTPHPRATATRDLWVVIIRME